MSIPTNPVPRQPSLPSGLGQGAAVYVPTRIIAPGKILHQATQLCWRILHAVGLGPLTYGILWEIRTAPHRIAVLSAYNKLPQMDPGPAWGKDSNGDPVYCNRRWNRTRNRQDLRAMWPWASPVEELLFVEAWDMGADWALRTNDKEREGNKAWRDQCIGDCSRPNRLMR